MSDWEQKQFIDLFKTLSSGHSINKSDYLTSGEIPVIDQSQDRIAGYANDGKVITEIPIIVFGDHTRVFKYVDFTFIPGADGTKLLKIKDDSQTENEVMFHYYQLLSIPIENKGYNRHFKLLKEKQLKVPPLPTQKKIAYILSTIQSNIENIDKQIQQYNDLKKSVMEKLFTEGLRGEKQKETEIGIIPESWEVYKVGDLCDTSSGGTPSRKNSKYWGGYIPWVKTGEVDYSMIYTAEEYITEDGLNNSSAKLFPKGTLLMAMYGQGVTRGKVAILGIDAATNQACVAIIPKDENILRTEYLRYYFEYEYARLRQGSHGAQQKNLSAQLVKLFEIALPKDSEQIEIVEAIQQIDKKINKTTRERKLLSDLFNSMLHKIMNQEIEVDDLDIKI